MFSFSIVFLHFLLIVTISGVCVVADRLLSVTEGVTKALVDNVTHGVVSFVAGIVILLGFRSMNLGTADKGLLLVMSYAFGAGIDVDHFIAARSLSLQNATNLDPRPFLHCSTIPLALLVVLFFIPRWTKFSIWMTILFTAFATHHFRDGTRRGLWFLGYGSTSPIPYNIYILLEVLTPYLVILLTQRTAPKGGSYYRLIHTEIV